jgi:hypothetical protein
MFAASHQQVPKFMGNRPAKETVRIGADAPREPRNAIRRRPRQRFPSL